MAKTKPLTNQHIVISGHNTHTEITDLYSNVNEIFLWKIGDNHRPAGPDDIEDFQKTLVKALADKTGICHIISHHGVEFQKIKL